MSSVWKRPSLSGPVTLAARLAVAEQETPAETTRCAECKEQLVQSLEDNLLAAARLRAAALEREARQRAEELLAAARAEAQRMKEAAMAAGHEEGYQAGFAAGRETAQELVRAAEELRAEAEQERQQLLAALEPKLVELAVELARRILRREVRSAPADIRELLAAAAAKLPPGTEITIEVAPGELPVWKADADLVQEAVGDRSYKLKESANVPLRQFVLTSEMGTVDARLESQLEACRDRLFGGGTDA